MDKKVSKILKLSSGSGEQLAIFLKNNLKDCISTLKHGGVIVFPTETLYGLGVDITDSSAIDRLISLKQRPKNMPIAVAVANIHQARSVATLSNLAENIIKKCLPKPITILVPVSDNIDRKLTGGSELIGLRFPDEPVTRAIIEQFGPITATSANLHGDPEPKTIEPVFNRLGSEIEIYIDTGPCKLGQPSTVIDTSGDTIKIIRDGACSGDELNQCL